MSETLTLFETDADLVEQYLADADRPISIDWRTRACIDKPTEIWFPEINQRRARDDDPIWNDARAICGGCPERIPCMAYSVVEIRTVAIDGMFGGRTPGERRELLDELLRRKVIA